MIFGVVILAMALLYGTVCTIAGFTANPGSLANFRSEMDDQATRRFRESVPAVQQAYANAVKRVPGMRLVDESAGALLIDLRPTSRILGGNFGLVIRAEFAPYADQTEVRISARSKLSWAIANHRSALRTAETALRMRAKESGIEQLIPGVNC